MRCLAAESFTCRSSVANLAAMIAFWCPMVTTRLVGWDREGGLQVKQVPTKDHAPAMYAGGGAIAWQPPGWRSEHERRSGKPRRKLGWPGRTACALLHAHDTIDAALSC